MEFRFFIHEPREFSQMGSASPVNVLIGFLRVFTQFDSIAPAFSPFGPTVGCSTSYPPRYSVVVQMGSAWEELRAEEDLSVPVEVRKIPALTDSRYKVCSRLGFEVDIF
jgi:hypothetical protein